MHPEKMETERERRDRERDQEEATRGIRKEKKTKEERK
jgi:hypothetical protein